MSFVTSQAAENFIFKDYLRVEPYLKGLDAYNRHPQLTRALLDQLGQPDNQFQTVCVTGSKGKGSITLLTAKALETLGYRVGVVVSPHYVNFRERIQLNSQPISEADFIYYVNKIAPLANAQIQNFNGNEYLSPTGLILATACLYFADKKVDFAIIEAGRGGRFDDCVVLANNLALFGPVLLEHTDKLGASLAEIADNKVALLKPNGYGVTVPQASPVQAVFEQWGTEVGGKWQWVGQDIKINSNITTSTEVNISLETKHNTYSNVALPLPALYEADNLGVALAGVELLLPQPILDLTQSQNLASGLHQVQLPGRMHILDHSPLTVADCAVTVPSVRLVLASLQAQLNQDKGRITAIVGVPNDREWLAVVQELASVVDTLILTQVSKRHLHFPENVLEYVQQKVPSNIKVLQTPDFVVARQAVPSTTTTLLVIGTQSVVAAALKYYGWKLV